jgi:hypothetical protein
MEPVAYPNRPVAAGTAVVADNSTSAVAWGAVLAGAAAAGALSLILAFLGFGLGMSAISPWAGDGASATTLGVGSIVWITLTQIAAASVGGYLAGRLRTRWSDVQRDEVYFRDTAHGLLAWAVATLVVATCLGMTLGRIGKAGAEIGAQTVATTAGAAVATGASLSRDGEDAGMGYVIDGLMRQPATAPATPDPAGMDAAPGAADPNRGAGPGRRAEVARIFANAARTGALPDTDTQYLAQIVAQRTGVSATEAEAQVRRAQAQLQQAATEAKEAADKARKAAAYASLWLFIALLGGAFFASLSATFGGRQRDL